FHLLIVVELRNEIVPGAHVASTGYNSNKLSRPQLFSIITEVVEWNPFFECCFGPLGRSWQLDDVCSSALAGEVGLRLRTLCKLECCREAGGRSTWVRRVDVAH